MTSVARTSYCFAQLGETRLQLDRKHINKDTGTPLRMPNKDPSVQHGASDKFRRIQKDKLGSPSAGRFKAWTLHWTALFSRHAAGVPYVMSSFSIILFYISSTNDPFSRANVYTFTTQLRVSTNASTHIQLHKLCNMEHNY